MPNIATPDSQETRDNQFLSRAIELSGRALEEGTGGPFGAVVVFEDRIVGEGRNRVTCNNDPTAHAEVEAIRAACQELSRFSLEGCTIYSSCEPCPMCLSAIYWARLERLVYANTRQDAAAIDFDDAAIYRQVALPLEQQALTAVHRPTEAALAVFERWQADDQKIPY